MQHTKLVILVPGNFRCAIDGFHLYWVQMKASSWWCLYTDSLNCRVHVSVCNSCHDMNVVNESAYE